MTTGSSQAIPSDDKNRETAQIATFAWDTAIMALSRYRSRFFLVYVSGLHSLEHEKRIHSSLNIVSWHSNHHSKKGPKVASFWLNCSRGNGDVEDSSGALYQLIHADPPLVRRTGRKRKEVSADDGVSAVNCEEFEVLLPEEALIRQCYYCLSWEDSKHRHSQIRNDKYWCSKCKKKGRFLSTLTPKEKHRKEIRGDLHPAERESVYA